MMILTQSSMYCLSKPLKGNGSALLLFPHTLAMKYVPKNTAEKNSDSTTMSMADLYLIAVCLH